MVLLAVSTSHQLVAALSTLTNPEVDLIIPVSLLIWHWMCMNVPHYQSCA